jgi:hypothetical protein
MAPDEKERTPGRGEILFNWITGEDSKGREKLTAKVIGETYGVFTRACFANLGRYMLTCNFRYVHNRPFPESIPPSPQEWNECHKWWIGLLKEEMIKRPKSTELSIEGMLAEFYQNGFECIEQLPSDDPESFIELFHYCWAMGNLCYTASKHEEFKRDADFSQRLIELGFATISKALWISGYLKGQNGKGIEEAKKPRAKRAAPKETNIEFVRQIMEEHHFEGTGDLRRKMSEALGVYDDTTYRSIRMMQKET